MNYTRDNNSEFRSTNLLLMILQFFIYFLLYLYLDKITSGSSGVSKPCCFCIKKKKKVSSKQQNYEESPEIELMETVNKSSDHKLFIQVS